MRMIGRSSTSSLVATLARKEFIRRLTTSARLSDAKEKKGNWPTTGWYQGHVEDPVRNTWDAPLPGTTRTFFYRQPEEADKYRPFLDTAAAHYASALVFFWFFYYLYYNPWKLFGGDYYLPYLSEFTDSELGIPPDDGPDPEYWGKQQPKGYGNGNMGGNK